MNAIRNVTFPDTLIPWEQVVKANTDAKEPQEFITALYRLFTGTQSEEGLSSLAVKMGIERIRFPSFFKQDLRAYEIGIVDVETVLPVLQGMNSIAARLSKLAIEGHFQGEEALAIAKCLKAKMQKEIDLAKAASSSQLERFSVSLAQSWFSSLITRASSISLREKMQIASVITSEWLVEITTQVAQKAFDVLETEFYEEDRIQIARLKGYESTLEAKRDWHRLYQTYQIPISHLGIKLEENTANWEERKEFVLTSIQEIMETIKSVSENTDQKMTYESLAEGFDKDMLSRLWEKHQQKKEWSVVFPKSFYLVHTVILEKILDARKELCHRIYHVCEGEDSLESAAADLGVSLDVNYALSQEMRSFANSLGRVSDAVLLKVVQEAFKNEKERVLKELLENLRNVDISGSKEFKPHSRKIEKLFSLVCKAKEEVISRLEKAKDIHALEEGLQSLKKFDLFLEQIFQNMQKSENLSLETWKSWIDKLSPRTHFWQKRKIARF